MLPGFSALSAAGQAAMLGTFRRNRAAMEAWQAGASYRQVADQFGMQPSQVHYLVGAPEPSFWRVYRYCKRLEATDPTIRARRTGLSSTPRGLTSLESLLTSVKGARTRVPG
jgi:hypothetical protein